MFNVSKIHWADVTATEKYPSTTAIHCFLSCGKYVHVITPLYSQVTQDMKWKHLYNKLGLSSQITSASYSLKMAYKKHLFPFEEHQRTNNNDKDNDKGNEEALENRVPSPVVKTNDQQSGDDECGSVASSKSSHVDQEPDQCNGPPPNHNDENKVTKQEVTENDAMDTTDSNAINRYFLIVGECLYSRGILSLTLVCLYTTNGTNLMSDRM